MKQKTFKNIRTVCIIALALCGIWALVMLGHFLTMSLAPNHDFFGKMAGLNIMDRVRTPQRKSYISYCM